MREQWVLVVDDDRDTREMLCQALALEGYHVRGAADAEEALSLLKGPVRYSLAVLDLILPGSDGLALLAALERLPEARRIPVIAISASLPRRPPPAAAFLHKPFGLDALLEKVARLLELRPIEPRLA